MRRSVIAGLIAAVLVLSGCGGGNDNPGPSPSPASSTVAPTDAKSRSIDAVTVKGKQGKTPVVDFDAPLVAKNSSQVVKKGDGDTVSKGQIVTAKMMMLSGNNGKVLESNFGSKQSSRFPVDKSQINPALFNAVKGTKVGSRVLLLLNGSAGDNKAKQTLVYVIDITSAKTLPTKAEGKKVPHKNGLPKVTRASNGKPSVSVPDTKPPQKLVVQPLIKGHGKKITDGDDVTVKYTGVLWKNGKKFDSSWGQSPDTFSVSNIGQANVIEGWNKGLIGQTVGSQVLLVVPPKMGYGSKDQKGIPGGSTLVFVIDILDANG